MNKKDEETEAPIVCMSKKAKAKRNYTITRGDKF